MFSYWTMTKHWTDTKNIWVTGKWQNTDIESLDNDRTLERHKTFSHWRKTKYWTSTNIDDLLDFSVDQRYWFWGLRDFLVCWYLFVEIMILNAWMGAKCTHTGFVKKPPLTPDYSPAQTSTFDLFCFVYILKKWSEFHRLFCLKLLYMGTWCQH